MSSWRRNRALFDSLRLRRETEKGSLRSLRYRNGISHISGDSRVTQEKQRNPIVVTQTIPLARIVLSIGEAYSRRAANNSRSTDNVRSKLGIDRTNRWIAGHLVRSFTDSFREILIFNYLIITRDNIHVSERKKKRI